jgi:hypothetical protein
MRKRTNKRRKRTEKQILQEKADRLWSVAVRDDWNNQCAACGRSTCEAHHLIPRQHQTTRYDLRNGIALCAHCHQFNRDRSPHQNAAGFMAWIETEWPGAFEWYTDTMENGVPRFEGIVNEAYYHDEIRRLKEYVPEAQYRTIIGARRAAWLEENQ